MRPDSRHAKAPGLRPRIFASPQTTDARWLPIHRHALSSTHRWRDPARQPHRIAAIPFSFERYALFPGRHIFLVLHGIAETFGLDAELAESVQGHQSAMRVERHDMSEDAAEREGLRRFAQSVDERIIPGGAVSNVPENAMQFRIGLFEPLSHRLRGALRLGSAVH